MVAPEWRAHLGTSQERKEEEIGLKVKGEYTHYVDVFHRHALWTYLACDEIKVLLSRC